METDWTLLNLHVCLCVCRLQLLTVLLLHYFLPHLLLSLVIRCFASHQKITQIKKR